MEILQAKITCSWANSLFEKGAACMEKVAGADPGSLWEPGHLCGLKGGGVGWKDSAFPHLRMDSKSLGL